MWSWRGALVPIFLLVPACQDNRQEPASAPVAGREDRGEATDSSGSTEEGTMKRLDVKSDVFAEGASIPRRHTKDGEDLSPPLRWSAPPAGTKSLAVICDDPDAPVGTWDHWVLWGLSPETTELKEGVPRDASLAGGALQGRNSWKRVGYEGPSPPPGKPHRYFFKVCALDTMLALKSGATKAELLAAIKGHVLAEGQVMGKYGR
ncbi:MAG: YbhB/YbcL family Raf kinase inhibitor-like protein [Planctomycetota bacterium]